MTGIYRITNTKNGKSYIGQSKDISRRFSEHKTMLRHGYHPSEQMQSDWNKTEEKDWFFEVLAECSEDDLNKMENKYINEENTIEHGYNSLYSIRGNEYSILAAKRIECNLSQGDLAKMTGVSVSMIQFYEQGVKDINKAQGQTLKKLAQALGCAMEDLID